MGKVRRARQKFHLAAIKAKAEEKKVTFAPEVDKHVAKVGAATLQSNVFSGVKINVDDLFKSLPSLEKSNLDQSSTSTDVQTSASSIVDALDGNRAERLQLKNVNITKKEKMRMKHSAFLHQINVIQRSRKKVRERKGRQKVSITRDMRPLLDSLPTLKSLIASEMSGTHKSHPPKVVPGVKAEPGPGKKASLTEAARNDIPEKSCSKRQGRKMKTFKALHKQMLSDIEKFHQVNQHPEFKEKPEATIIKHLYYKFKYSDK